jgi:uncharacterized protein (DUF305 family)
MVDFITLIFKLIYMDTKTIMIGVGALIIGIVIGSYTDINFRKFHNDRYDMGSMMHTMDMDSMMQSMTGDLVGKTGIDFDQAFLSGMIVHHQGAVAMAEMVLKQTTNPELIKLANDIIKAQTTEINQMKSWQTTWKK